MTKGNQIIKFRATGNEKEIISIATKKLGLNNESAVIRILLQLGLKQIDEFLENAYSVAHPLKYSEIDYLTSSLNIFLKGKKRALNKESSNLGLK